MTTFRGGIGMIASRLDLPVVPVQIEGVHRILHVKSKFPTARARCTRARSARRCDLQEATIYAALAREVEQAGCEGLIVQTGLRLSARYGIMVASPNEQGRSNRHAGHGCRRAQRWSLPRAGGRRPRGAGPIERPDAAVSHQGRARATGSPSASHPTILSAESSRSAPGNHNLSSPATASARSSRRGRPGSRQGSPRPRALAPEPRHRSPSKPPSSAPTFPGSRSMPTRRRCRFHR